MRVDQRGEVGDLQLVVARDAADLSRKAFALVERLLAGRTDPVVVLPTGNTPLGLYAEAVRNGPKGRLARARFVGLDEYIGLSSGDCRLLSGWLARVLLDPLGIDRDRLLAFESACTDPAAEAARVERLVRRSGIDLAILGLGPNGHLGFNEPGSRFNSRTRAVTLTPESIASNAVYWGSAEAVPRTAFTLGLGTLKRAGATILLVSGAHKADILRRTMSEPPSARVPATCLRHFANCTVIADRAAAAGLTDCR